MAAAGYGGLHSRFSRRHQGPAHDAGRRRDSLAQRDAAAGARPIRLRSPRTLFPGRALARTKSRAHERGDLPRKYGRRLRRDRVEVRHAGSEEADRFSERRDAQGRKEAHARGFRRRHQADVSHGHEAAGPARHPACNRQRPHRGHAGAQRQHSEIHRRRVPRLGLRTCHAGIPPVCGHRARKLDSRQQGQRRGPERRAKRRDDRARARTGHRRFQEDALRRSEANARLNLSRRTETASGRRKS